MKPPKHAKAAALVREQIASGTLAPGQHAPSGAELARVTGYSVLTCRRALRDLVTDGTLTAGPSPNARPCVPSEATSRQQALTDAARTLSATLASRRRAAGLTQPQLAKLVGLSVTTIGHAETGRTWQGRPFWERADHVLAADGELLRLHDAYRAAQAASPGTGKPPLGETGTLPVAATIAVNAPVSRVTIIWADGTATTVRPPVSPETSNAVAWA